MNLNASARLIGLIILSQALSGPTAFAECSGQPTSGVSQVLENAAIDTYLETKNAIQDMSEGLKSNSELTSYLVALGYKGFLTYKHDIEVAANSFHLPAPFLACELAAESGFHAREESRSGAEGIGQMEVSSIQTVNDIISGRNSKTKVSDSPESIVRDLWSNYPWQAIQTTPKKYFTSYDRTLPKQMIPVSAMFAKMKAIELFGDAGAADLSPEKIQILVASYNLGSGAIRSICGRTQIENPDACLYNLNPRNHAPSAAAHRRALPQVWAEMNKISDCIR